MAFRGPITVALTLLVVYVVKQFLQGYRNYAEAKRTGLPVLVQPFGMLSPVWLFSRGILKRVFASQEWVQRIDGDWHHLANIKPFNRMGTKAYWLVSPAGKELLLADPLACEDVLKRCKTDFPKNPTWYFIHEVHGQNVISTNGKTWERHRKITAPPFNERVSETVWDESGRQAEDARRVWLDRSRGQDQGHDVRTLQEDMSRVAFHILSTAGFGISFDFEDVPGRPGAAASDEAAGRGDEKARHIRYRQVLFLILNDISLLVGWIVARRIGWPAFAMWGGVKAAGEATVEYGRHLKQMIREEREYIRSGRSKEGARANLMSTLIKAADEGDGDGSVKAGPALTDEEVSGNLFILNIAGHETTANALCFAILLLAANPETQEWLAEEIDAVMKEDQSSLKYASVFPKLHRCVALMYEVLRCAGPVPFAPRWTGTSSRVLTIDGRQYTIPADTDVHLDLAALHLDTSVWGDDAQTFRPERWIPQAGESKPVPTAAREVVGTYDWQSESVVSPQPGTFIPWTSGPRVCPGKKFSQVEFVSFILRLFRDGGRVRVAQEGGETPEQARGRALEVVQHPKLSITLKVDRPERVGLKWFIKDA